MNIKTKVRILSHLVFIVIFLITWTILHFTFEHLENPYKGMISAGVSSIFAPRLNEFQSQSGKQMQLKWIFLRKPITI
jgi:hypothetical protein